MKTPFKWSINTALILLIICVLSIFITGNISDGQPEKSNYGKSAYNSGKSITYLKNADISFESPKSWGGFFKDTKKGLQGDMANYGIDFLLIDDTWQYYVEIFIADSKDELPSLAAEEKNYYVPIAIETYTSGDITYEKETAQIVNTFLGDYSLYTIYSTNFSDKYVSFQCYYYSMEPLDVEKELKILDNKMLPIIKSIHPGNATEIIPESNEKSFWETAKNFSFSIWIFILPLACILLCGMKIKDPDYVPSAKELRMLDKGLLKESDLYGTWQENPLGLTQSKSLLGFFALLIVMHHMVQTIGSSNASIFWILEEFGVCFVGAFFFFSGYGLMKSTIEKEGYLKEFLKKRFPTVLIPFYMCISVFLLVDVCCGKRYTLLEWIQYLTGWILRNTHMWYIVEIAFLYFAFYLTMRFVKRRSHALGILFLFLTLLTATSLLLCHGEYWFQGEWWYNSTFIFFFGIIFADREEKLLNFCKKYYVLLVILCLSCFIFFYRITSHMLLYRGYWTESAANSGYADKVLTLLPQITMTFFFVSLVILVSLKCRFHNSTLQFLGKISLELYLIHNLFLQYLSDISGIGLYVTGVLLCSIVAANILHDVDTYILCLIYRRPFPKKQDIRPILKEYFHMQKKRIRACVRYTLKNPKNVAILCFRTLACVGFCLLSVAPLYLLFINSTRTSHSLVRGISLLPEGHFMENFEAIKGMFASETPTLYSAIGNSLIVSVPSCLLAIYFGCLCAYGFEMFRFRGRKWLWRVNTLAMMFPQAACSIGLFHLAFQLGMINTFTPLILPYIATPSVAYFMRMYLRMIPLESIVEAARIDGCSELGIFHRMILPSVKSALSLQLIFTFVASWNNGYMQSLILQDREIKTLATYMQSFAGARGASGDPGIYVLMLVTTIPPLIVYLLFSKSIASRIVLGNVKE